MKIYPTFYKKSFKKGTLKPKIEKRALLHFFYYPCSDIRRKKIANFSTSSLVAIILFRLAKLMTFVLAYTLKIIGKCKQKNLFLARYIKVSFELV